MEEPISWQRFDRIAKVLESLGYLVVVFGPLLGIALLIFGNWAIRAMGLAIVFASFLIAAYHISFALLMNGVRDITRHLEQVQQASGGPLIVHPPVATDPPPHPAT